MKMLTFLLPKSVVCYFVGVFFSSKVYEVCVCFLVVSFYIEASLWITPEALSERTECYIIQFRFLYLPSGVSCESQDGHHASVCTERSKLISQFGNLTVCLGHAWVITGRRSRDLSSSMERKSMHTSLKYVQQVLVRQSRVQSHPPYNWHVAIIFWSCLFKEGIASSSSWQQIDFSVLLTIYFRTFICSWSCMLFKFHGRVCCEFLRPWNLSKG